VQLHRRTTILDLPIGVTNLVFTYASRKDLIECAPQSESPETRRPKSLESVLLTNLHRQSITCPLTRRTSSRRNQAFLFALLKNRLCLVSLEIHSLPASTRDQLGHDACETLQEIWLSPGVHPRYAKFLLETLPGGVRSVRVDVSPASYFTAPDSHVFDGACPHPTLDSVRIDEYFQN